MPHERCPPEFWRGHLLCNFGKHYELNAPVGVRGRNSMPVFHGKYQTKITNNQASVKDRVVNL